MKQVHETMEVRQGKICIGLRTGVAPVSEAYYALLLFSEMLGGSANSRLFATVRERESLCYYINSFVYRFKTILCIQSGVESENFERVLEMIQHEVEEMKRGNFEPVEFENARNSLAKKFNTLQDSQVGVIDFYATQKIIGDEGTLQETVETINRLTREQVVSAAGGITFDTVFTLSLNER